MGVVSYRLSHTSGRIRRYLVDISMQDISIIDFSLGFFRGSSRIQDSPVVWHVSTALLLAKVPSA